MWRSSHCQESRLIAMLIFQLMEQRWAGCCQRGAAPHQHGAHNAYRQGGSIEQSYALYFPIFFSNIRTMAWQACVVFQIWYYSLRNFASAFQEDLRKGHNHQPNEARQTVLARTIKSGDRTAAAQEANDRSRQTGERASEPHTVPSPRGKRQDMSEGHASTVHHGSPCHTEVRNCNRKRRKCCQNKSQIVTKTNRTKHLKLMLPQVRGSSLNSKIKTGQKPLQKWFLVKVLFFKPKVCEIPFTSPPSQCTDVNKFAQRRLRSCSKFEIRLVENKSWIKQLCNSMQSLASVHLLSLFLSRAFIVKTKYRDAWSGVERALFGAQVTLCFSDVSFH